MIVDPAVPNNQGLVLDKTAVVSAVGSVQVANSEHALFAADSTAVRCTGVSGPTSSKPSGSASSPVTAPTS